MNRIFTRFVSRHVSTGHLTLTFPDGSARTFGDGSGPPVVAWITSNRTIWRLALNPELALGEAFMDGTFQMKDGSIYDFLELISRNTRARDVRGLPRLVRKAFGLFNRLTGYNSITRSKSNVTHHYDLNGDLYRLFLDPDAQYSCGYFEESGATLEQAQLAKKRHLVAKLLIEPGQRVLDIGSGWGGLGLYLAKHCGVQVKGVTLSEEQHSLSNARANGFEAQVRFDLQDYRSVTERFDRIVSVGMFEHVGRASYDTFFAKARNLLSENGVMLLHYIGQSAGPAHTNPWILKYIFPGGYMPALSEVLPVIERQQLIVTDIETLRLHYAETIRHWRMNFLARRAEAVALYDERFARMWEFYLSCSETGFRYQGLVIHQIQLARRQDAVPLTRAYIERAEAALRQAEARPVAVNSGSSAEKLRHNG